MLLDNAVVTYYQEIRSALRNLLGGRAAEHFTPGVELPELTPALREYFAVSSLAHLAMSSHRGAGLSLLDLARNPATGTTKTFASLVIVARAVRFIHDTGQRVTLVTPSSANKAIALRDAVLRAIRTGLVGSDQLNVVTVVPEASVAKLRCSDLFTDPVLRARNPIAVYGGEQPGTVKAIALQLVERFGDVIGKENDTNLWYTLQLENYLAADIVRALAEADLFPAARDEARVHVHAVSSAYGLLGHAHGRDMLPEEVRTRTLPPRYLMVQHLGAPDMVLSLHNAGSTDVANLPAYARDAVTGLFTQEADARYPAQTYDPDETLDPTFYTRNPPTSSRMNDLIRTQGGGGIVVSLAECLNRFAQVRTMLGDVGVRLPANPTELREWSLVMSMTGALNAIDRGLVTETDVLVHGSGSYATGDYEPLTVRDLHPVATADDLRRVVRCSASLP